MTDILTVTERTESHADHGWGRVRSRLRQPTKEELDALRNRDVADFLNSVAWTSSSSCDLDLNSEPPANVILTLRGSAGTQSDPQIKATYLQHEKSGVKKSLKVGFAAEPPEIIGEGGDESREPATTVGRVRERKPSAGAGLLLKRGHLVARTYSCDVIPTTNRPSMPRILSSMHVPTAPDDALSPTSMPEGLRIRKPSHPSLDDVSAQSVLEQSTDKRSEHLSDVESKPSSQDVVEHLKKPSSKNNSRRGSASDHNRAHVRKEQSTRPNAPSRVHTSPNSVNSLYDNLESIPNLEGCIMGSTSPRLSPSSKQVVTRQRANSSMSGERPAMKRPSGPSHTKSFDPCTVGNGSLPNAVQLKSRVACLTSQPAQSAPSPLSRQYSWSSDVSEQLLERPQSSVLSQDQTEDKAQPRSPFIIIPERHPGRLQKVSPIEPTQDMTKPMDFSHPHPAKKHLIPPPFDRRPSAPALSRGQTFADLAVKPNFERRPSAPFLSQEATFTELNHPAFRRASSGDESKMRPKPASRRGSAAQIEKTSHSPSRPHLSTRLTEEDDNDVLSLSSIPSLTVQPSEQQEVSPTSRPQPTRTPSYMDSKNIALGEFVERTSHMTSVINISAMAMPVSQFSTAKWLQLATFWMLKGRAGLNIYLSAIERDDEDEASDTEDSDLTAGQHSIMLAQQHLNIFKTWWIISEVLGPRLEGADDSKEFKEAAETYRTAVFQLTDALVDRFKELALWIADNEVLPMNPVLVPGLDSSLWLQDATFPEDLKMLRRML